MDIIRDIIDRNRWEVAFAIRSNSMSEKEFLEAEIDHWKHSEARKLMLTGERYYNGDHDILQRQRTARSGKDEQEVKGVPNCKIVDNQYARLLEQKVNYMLANPVSVRSKDPAYAEALTEIFGEDFDRTLKSVCVDSINYGVAYVYVTLGPDGKLLFCRIPAVEVLPFWRDANHTEMDMAVRIYKRVVYEGKNRTIKEFAEVYKPEGVEFYRLESGRLIPDAQTAAGYVSFNDANGEVKDYTWGRIPLAAFKYNHKEEPLIKCTKSLQDSLNLAHSDFANSNAEDARNTILVLKNYDGTNLEEFRHNLNTYGVVKVRADQGGGVDTLKIDVSPAAYEALRDAMKRALVENAKGYDAREDSGRGNVNELNIKSMYSDIELDIAGMETEYQAALQQLLYFVNVYLASAGKGDFSGEKAEFTFTHSIMVNEGGLIDNIVKSADYVSKDTLMAKHPWIADVEAEKDRLKEQMEEDINGLQPV